MLANSFYSSDLKKGFLFSGSSGQLKNGKWVFVKVPTLYARDPSGWIASEKIDGVRAVWNPTGFVSRVGKPFQVPADFISAKKWPKGISLDGELHVPGQSVGFVSGMVHRKAPQDWSALRYFVFDVIGIPGNFLKRLERLEFLVSTLGSDKIVILKQIRINNMQEAYKLYKHTLQSGGEGLVLRDPNSTYEDKRSNAMLKWKPSPSAEAKIIGFQEGTGKYKSKLGAFIVSFEDQEFSLSGKIPDSMRLQYKFNKDQITIMSFEVPQIGDLVTFEFMTISEHGIPRQPIFIAVRRDL